MRIRDDEARFREAVAAGETAAAAAIRLRIPKRMIGYFIKRLPKVTAVVPPKPKPVATVGVTLVGKPDITIVSAPRGDTKEIDG